MDQGGESGAGLRTDIEAHPVLLDAADWEFPDGIPVHSRGGEVVGGEDQSVGVGVEQLARLGNPLRLDERAAGREPLGGREGVGHRAADHDAVGAAQERADHRQLVGNLGAPEDGDEGTGGISERPTERREFRLHQRTGGRSRKTAGAGVHRGVGAVGGAEGVVHVFVAVGGERGGELGRVPGLPRVEAKVLEEKDFARLESGRRFHLVTDRRGLEADRLAEEILKALGDRPQAEGGIRLAGRPTQMGSDNDRGSLAARRVDRGERGADPAVVADRPVLEGGVEIRPQEELPSVQIEFRKSEFPGSLGHCRANLTPVARLPALARVVSSPSHTRGFRFPGRRFAAAPDEEGTGGARPGRPTPL